MGIAGRTLLGLAAVLTGFGSLSGCIIRDGCDPNPDTPVSQHEYTHQKRASEASSITRLRNDDLLLIGMVADDYSFLGDVLLVRTDDKGNQRWTASIESASGLSRGHRVAEVGENFLILGNVGATRDGAQMDYLLMATSARGSLQWERRFGGTGKDVAADMVVLPDGYMVLGTTDSTGSGGTDMQLHRLDSAGTVQWSATYGGAGHEIAADLALTDDGGFILLGDSESMGHNVTDFYLVKTDEDGVVQWEESYGYSRSNIAASLSIIPTGGYLLTGSSDDVNYIVAVDAQGGLMWEKLIAPEPYYRYFYPSGGAMDSEGNVLLTGAAYDSFCSYAFVTKVDGTGELLWSRVYSPKSVASGYGIIANDDGTSLVVGRSVDFSDVGLGVAALLVEVSADGN